jgi:hypothetical protein
MTRANLLIAALLCLPLPVGAQSPEWKAIACTVEAPESERGTIITIYFADNGQVRLGENQYPATVTSAEIRFSFPFGDGGGGKVYYTISRISGRFAMSGNPGRLGSFFSVNGTCMPEGAKPKF